MNISSVKFIKSIIGTDSILEDGKSQIAFIGRSNVGKSSVINAFANQKNLARTSSFPGRTQQMNIFLVNKSFYLVDLPGYGFARVPKEVKEKINKMVDWYFFDSKCKQKKIVLIIDAKIGPTKDDMEMLDKLEEYGKNVVIVANKIDKLKKSEFERKIAEIQDFFKPYKVVPFSAEKRKGINELEKEIAR